MYWVATLPGIIIIIVVLISTLPCPQLMEAEHYSQATMLSGLLLQMLTWWHTILKTRHQGQVNLEKIQGLQNADLCGPRHIIILL